MGRSAKVHKRVSKKVKSSANTQVPSQTEQQLQASKKKATLKEKSKQASSAKINNEGSIRQGGHVLGGADYVSLLMGGRRKAREEGAKLPRGDSD
ncbi:hypothetical protein EV361DRAFT_893736 [Lentinula raphanica]|uniref:Uncharacterized protein n=1 Tax=Lentinula raphanica TaxID=153919 RepID=A0AA38PCR3_9AGAR|nr:hypothetical protein FB446DRAFT_717271 [Lentinula raphanica]KAJ3826807.1 hypothetical protein F5880DRAFT_29473 [Lentinula raphanica]KAJ3840515.1 hypothetical protein F5878DRAFT_68058 [Lentinula raphanica]KAJ3974620.1 hypothetical protein EV361DRAFT_893736 [Lentinula raphanica]